MRISSLRGLALVYALIGFLPSIMAQDGAADGMQIIGINRQYDDQKSQAQMEVDAARLEFAACASREASSKINSAAQDSANKAQAMQGLLGSLTPSVGNLADSAMNAGNSEKAASKAELANIETDVKDMIRTCRAISFSNTTGVTGVGSVVCDDKSGCAKSFPSSTHESGTNRTTTTNCVQEFQKWKSETNTKFFQAKRDLAGASDLSSELMKASLTAGVGIMGASMGIKAGKANTEAQRKVAALDRKGCELNANNLLNNANRKLAQTESLRNQDLLNASLQAAAAKQKLISPNVTVDPDAGAGGGLSGVGTAGSAEPGLGGGGGAPTAPEAQAAAAGGGAGGGGGGGGAQAGESPWGFGNGKGGGEAGGGGLPPQPEAATFGDSGSGGGGGGGGFGGFGMEGDEFANAMSGMGEDAGQGNGEMMLGDGGISVLMNRMRARLAAHAGDLVQSIDIKQMAKSTPESSKRKPTSDGKAVSLDRL